MINLCDLGQVYLVCGKTDLRKGIDGLACLIRNSFNLILFRARSFSFAAAEKTVLKPCIGTAKDIGYCINALKTAR